MKSDALRTGGREVSQACLRGKRTETEGTTGRRRNWLVPRTSSCPSGLSKCPYKIFSESVRGRLSLFVELRRADNTIRYLTHQ